MKKLTGNYIAVAFMLLIVACGPAVEPTNELQPSQPATNTPLPSPRATNTPQTRATAANTLEPPTVGDCDPATDLVGINTRVSTRVLGGSYPDSCEMFCLWVPNGSRLEIGISDFVVDLDIFVDSDLSILQYEDHGRWQSDAYGTVNEQVTILNPAGRYIFKVCSFEGDPATFTLWNDFTP